MLRILHTADWHIGQYFYGHNRKIEHLCFLTWLKQVIKEQQIDVLLIAGDVFDGPNPSAESQTLYYHFLREVTSENPGLQIIIIAGNHDSAARLEAPNPLLSEMNIRVCGSVYRDPVDGFDLEHFLIPLNKDGQTEGWCVALPYLRQGDYPPSENYGKGVSAMYELLFSKIKERLQPGQAVVVMGHLHASGGELSDGDRSERILLGGLENVSAQIFLNELVTYTALGHLHKPQQLAGQTHIRYAGTPLPMSFSEKNYKHGVNFITIEDGQIALIERIDFDIPVRLISLPSKPRPLAEVLDCLASLPEGDTNEWSPFLEIKVLMTEPEPTLRYRIEQVLQGKAVRLARLLSVRPEVAGKSDLWLPDDLASVDPKAMAMAFFEACYDTPMPERMQVLLDEVIKEDGV